MLRIYTGRENIDKERFIYDRIGKRGGETLVLVPDQYTLVAEEQALRYTGTDCLFDIEILSMNRLGLRVLTEQGRESVSMLDRYCRFMLLTGLIREHTEDFRIFRRSAGRLSFTEMLSDFISEYKQNECRRESVVKMLRDEDADPLLREKLAEIMMILEAYEEAISGKYNDTEEYIDEYIEAIPDSALIKGKNIWIYGYDSVTPKFARAMLALASSAASVNFILNRSDFELDEIVSGSLRMRCAEQGIGFSCEEIGPEYEISKSSTIKAIEKGLFKDRIIPADIEPADLTVVRAANPYYEAETAAAYIWHLVRDLDFRLRDIQVIANDEGNMHPIIRRVFTEYGLPVFMDSARDITDTAPVSFIMDLLWFLVYNKDPQYMFAMIKTGLAGIPSEHAEDLENYVRSYHIRGSMWERDFKYGEEALGRELFTSLNSLRTDIMGKVEKLSGIASGKALTDKSKGGSAAAPPVDVFVPEFRKYLEEVWGLSEAVTAMADEEEALGFIDEAQRTKESYDRALGMLDQIAEIMGGSVLDLKEFTEIYAAGLTSVEVGVIPPAADGLSVGTMIRTRPRPVRAAVILGANEGILPMQPSTEGLFSFDEKTYFEKNDFALGSLDRIRQDEEKAAMYRMLSKPSEKLYISYALTDTDGREALPSEIIESLAALFPHTGYRVINDIVSSGWGVHNSGMINTPEESMRHMISRIKDRNAPEEPDQLLRAMLVWYREKRRGQLDIMLSASADDNEQKPLGKQTAGRLFGRSDGSLVLSASQIGNYFDCPFKYFIDRGLRPREEKDFSSDPRSIGDAYHECLMSVARKLIGDRQLLAALAEAGQKDEDSEDKCAGEGSAESTSEDIITVMEKMVDEELDRIAESYQGGLFVSAGSERFRMDRIREICVGAAVAMAEQLAAESIVDASFEEDFRRGGRFEPVTLEVDGVKVYVEGKIDRSDILKVGDGNRVRIIDYKTGSDKLDVWKMRNGYKMQLMIYMISASSEDLEPAGLFYFNIKDPIESLDNATANKAEDVTGREPGDTFKLRGRYIDEPGVLSAMPADVITGGRGEKDRRISREDYETLRSDVIRNIKNTADGILKGNIDIHPLNEGGLACTRCSYKPVCRRDREYTRNYAREITPEPKPDKGAQAGDGQK